MVKSFDKRIPHWLIPLLGSLVAFGPLSIDMYLPALPQMGIALHATQGQMQYTLGAFFAGFCVGMLFYGPLSDLLGRRKMLLSGLAIFTVASLLCAQATDANTLIIFRALQAFGSGAAIVMARAIARDVYPANELPKVLSLMTLVTMIAPLLAPLLGGFLLIHFQWQAIFYLLALVGLISVSAIFLLLPETLVHQRTSENLLCVAFKNYTQVLTDREALSIIGTMAFSFAGMFAFISGSPFVYINYFGVSEQHYGLLFGCNILGMIVMLLLNVKLLKIYSLTRILTMQSGFQLAFGLFLLLFYQQSLPIIVILVVLFLSMVNAIGTNSLSLLLQHRGKIAGSASALAISIQFALAALASVAVSVLQDESPFAMALVMAICAGLSFASQRLSAKNIRPQIQSVSSEKNEK
ncbi:Bcr/CflA family multidrug efflux MFS transporter [Providencia sp.]|uniref:Bcr/CflA family multidrug efflux MFS transporter n=1 Tax=Providencia sp. TaxID=589 RepID=UPI0033405366